MINIACICLFILNLNKRKISKLSLYSEVIKYDWSSFNKTLEGIDERHPFTYEISITETMRMKELYNKALLLRFLENPDISINNKIEKLNQFTEKKYVVDLTAGGLFKDWNYEQL
jgi:hypothetical protein